MNIGPLSIGLNMDNIFKFSYWFSVYTPVIIVCLTVYYSSNK